METHEDNLYFLNKAILKIERGNHFGAILSDVGMLRLPSIWTEVINMQIVKRSRTGLLALLKQAREAEREVYLEALKTTLRPVPQKRF